MKQPLRTVMKQLPGHTGAYNIDNPLRF